ncbi:hypothetical protein LTR86_011037 [Recurvomyces mirabilis]|nr:hypothetical protein LTR86_011037 [Recurvomyces mirabilis]
MSEMQTIVGPALLHRPDIIDASGELRTPHGNVHTNGGKSVADVEARSEKSESLLSWQMRSGIERSNQIRLVKLAHMRYQHPDIAKITEFLKDFGMRVAQQSEDGAKVWFCGYGSDQYVYFAQKGPEKMFQGGTFEVESMADLEKATQLPSASRIEEMVDAPGRGYIVTIQDPEGFPINLMYGQTLRRKGDPPPKIILNDETDKPRVRKFNRFTPGPAAVHKLGHYGLCVQNFEEQLKWYTRNFNLAPTDFLFVTSPKPKIDQQDGAQSLTKDVAVFAHIDRGAEPVDHHTFFMSANPTSHVHHCSFEVHDYDTQHLGHQWLARQGHNNVWGIGRHILGSQIFDYWWDTSGNMIEHYTDGDLVTIETPVTWGSAGDESLAVWGPKVPESFLQ